MGCRCADRAFARSSAVAVVNTDGEKRLDPRAAAAMEWLLQGGPRQKVDLEVARASYVERRSALLSPLEDIGGVVHIERSGTVPAMMVMRPRVDAKLLPALVYLHGGGWTIGDLGVYEPVLRQLANATGRIVVSVDYRLAPEHPFPAALEDTWNVVEWLVSNAEWIGIDKSRIAIGGDNSGGNLAAVTALAARDKLIGFAPQFQLLIYPCLDMTASLPSHAELANGFLLSRERYQWFRRNYTDDFPDLDDWHLSPLFVENVGGVAPAIVLYAEFDPLRDEAMLYCRRLLHAGVHVEPLFFSGLMHGFITMGGAVPAANEAVQRVASAIRKLERCPCLPQMAASHN